MTKTKKKATAPAASKKVPRRKATSASTKTETVIGLLKREDGATARELQEATGWQAHSVRGFISGVIAKKLGLDVKSTKNDTGDRVYSIVA